VLVSDFNYHLPEELIAQQPLADRAASQLLYLKTVGRQFKDPHLRDLHLQDIHLADLQFRDFPNLLRPDDLLVFNNTRVFPARLYGRRSGIKVQFPSPEINPQNRAPQNYLQGRIEVLLTRQVQHEPNEWECLVRPGRKIGVGEHLFFGENDDLKAEVVARGGFGERRIRFEDQLSSQDFFQALERIGHVPLPPYIVRNDSPGDRERYQTVYAHERGSVAAPTAGLHFTPEILAQIKARGIGTAEITLHVGLGTFQPIRTERVEEHKLHSESYSISPEAADKIMCARQSSRRIVAIGTTTVRTLEYAAQQTDGEVRAGSGEANLFIYPGYKFRVVNALLTNFHLPQSTLLMLVCALGGKENVMRTYEHAVSRRYRFYSYGDCMFVE
jgi:S-adenosylmethionine:tRNA ribosyltransferase-isomerase